MIQIACYEEFKLWIALVENLLASMIFDIESANKCIEAFSQKGIVRGWSVLRRSFPDVISCYNFMCDAQPSDIAPLLAHRNIRYQTTTTRTYIICNTRHSQLAATSFRTNFRFLIVRKLQLETHSIVANLTFLSHHIDYYSLLNPKSTSTL